MPRTHKEIIEALDTQRNHLAMSCRGYDAGIHSEALRLAIAVFIIAHDGGKNRCLLTHLGIKDQIPWETSNLDITSLRAVMLRATPLVELDNTPNGPDFVPLCTYTKNHDAFQSFSAAE